MFLKREDRKLLRPEFKLSEVRNLHDKTASIDFGVKLHKMGGDTIVYDKGDPVIAYAQGDEVELFKCRN